MVRNSMSRNELINPSVVVNGNAFTNAVITLGNVVSVGFACTPSRVAYVYAWLHEPLPSRAKW